jgi:cathepsin D
MCAGGIIDISNIHKPGFNTPSWIIGDTFLKNVYSVFRANPASVGFAQLASGLNSPPAGSNGSNPTQVPVSVPTPSDTPRSIVTVSNSSSSRVHSGAASINKNISVSLTVLAAVAGCFAIALLAI